MKQRHLFSFLILPLMLSGCAPSEPASSGIEDAIASEEARSIAKEAYIYGSPLADSYRILYTYFVDRGNPEYKAPWNKIYNVARVFTHEDRTVQAANSDTPYSFLGLDLRTEPIVLTVPPMEEERYFSIQLIDLYTYNFDYIGSRTTGNGGGDYVLVGPGWNGEMPNGIDKVFRSETELMLAIYRTQLYSPDDLEHVRDIQADYKVQPLSAYLGQTAPTPAPAIDFIAPLSVEALRSSPEIFNQLNFVLQFCPTHSSETALMERFARIGVGAGKAFDVSTFSPEIQAAIGQGIADAWGDFEGLQQQANQGEVTSGDVFGTREHLQNNYLYRMGAAVTGIWGNSEEEATYPTYYIDSEGQPPNGDHQYTLHFAPGQLPPVHAFWSLTMYGLPENLLVANPLNRYLLNSTMLSQFERDADGGITFYFQHESPGADKEANWLPAPEGPFSVNMRLYWPKAEALDGTWKEPPLQRVE